MWTERICGKMNVVGIECGIKRMRDAMNVVKKECEFK